MFGPKIKTVNDFHSLEVVGRVSETQLQVSEKLIKYIDEKRVNNQRKWHVQTKQTKQIVIILCAHLIPKMPDELVI